MYDEEFARDHRRAAIAPGERGRCAHCAHVGISTGSDYEWPCLILRDWICETHCTEIQLRSYADTRMRVAEQLRWQDDPDALLQICRRCPYRGIGPAELGRTSSSALP